jgi:hypothetical protein
LDITAYLRELLFGHDCVIVPGFGGFIGNYTPARIDSHSGTFYPPVKLISFNRNLNNNDGLLIGKISESAKVTYGDARNIVENFVIDLRRRLDNGGKVVFEKIGSFVNNKEGNVLFEPDRDINYLLDSYGLEPFQYLPLEGYDVRKRAIGQPQKDPVKQATMRRLIWRAAVVIPLISVLIAVPLKRDLFKAKVETSSMNPLVTAEFESNKIAVDNEKGEASTATYKMDGADMVNPPVSEVSVPETAGDEIFCIITGSFKSEENAVSQVNNLKNEGFTPEIIKAPNGFFRVSALRCNGLNTALTTKDSISKKFPGSWVKKIR